MVEQGEAIQTIAQQLKSYIASKKIPATVTLDENYLILGSVPANLHRPLKIRSVGDDLFDFTHTQGFPPQVYSSSSTLPQRTFTQSEALSEGTKWLTKLRLAAIH
jgi:hypothetical protein